MNRFKENMFRQLTTHEGLRFKPYLSPAGKLTIGFSNKKIPMYQVDAFTSTLLSRALGKAADNLKKPVIFPPVSGRP